MARFKGVLPESVLTKMSPADRKTLGKAGMTLAEAVAKREARHERDIHEQLMGWLGQRGITYRRDRMDKKTTGQVGWPDFTFALRGRAVALEVKLPGKDPTDDQIRVLAGLVKDGWAVRVVHNLEEALSFLREVEGATP